jgi:putative serine protease PepD
VTDGSSWRREPGPAPDVWWSDALTDPWRDPHAPTVVHVPDTSGVADRAPLEQPPAPPRRSLGLILMVSIITALLAGALGGTLGYVFALGGGAPLGGGSTLGNPNLSQRPPESIAGVVKKVLPSVVTIRSRSGRSGSLGSGFIASPDGFILTNEHVVSVSNSEISVIFADGREAPARLVGSEPESDVAVLKVEQTGLTVIEFGDSDAVQVGDPAIAIGAPLGLSNTVTSGIVSAVDRPVTVGEAGASRFYAAIQTDAAINQGNSGGPLLDLGGRVIGINSVIRATGSSEETAGNIGLGFAIPINQAKRQAQDIIERGKARRTVMGAVPDAAYRSPAGGVRLTSVQAGGPAEAAGLRAGDIIMKVDDDLLTGPDDLVALVRKFAPGAVVPVEFQRAGGAAQKVSVTLAADAN